MINDLLVFVGKCYYIFKFENLRATTHLRDREANSTSYGGLNQFGRKVIAEMNRLGMIVDLSHTSRMTMNDVLDVSEAPVIFSHSSIFSLCNNTRNVRDEILQKLVFILNLLLNIILVSNYFP